MSERGATAFESIESALTKWYGQYPFKLTEARQAYAAMIALKGEPSSIYTPKSRSYIAVTWPASGQQRDPTGTPALMELQFFTTFIAARVQLPGWTLSPKAPGPGQTGLWYCHYFPDFAATEKSHRADRGRAHCQHGCDPYGPMHAVGSKCPECDAIIADQGHP